MSRGTQEVVGALGSLGGLQTEANARDSLTDRNMPPTMTLTPRLSDPGASSSNTQQLAEQQQQHPAALVPQVAKDIEAVVKTAAMAASELPAEVRVPASKQAVDVLGVNSQDALLSSTSATNGHAANNEQFRQRRLSVTQVAMDEGARATQEAFTALFR